MVKPRVTLCMIAKDEEQNLPACLDSLAELVDEMVVVDTGSTDRTREVASRHGAKVFDFAWTDDFSAARNEALRHATGEWILWFDADDRLAPAQGDRLRTLLAGLGDDNAIYMMRCLSHVDPAIGPDCWVSHARLFRKQSGIAWQRRVHETILSEAVLASHEIRWTDIVIEHLGYRDQRQRVLKRQRDLRLLQLDYVLNPDDAMTLFYLGWTHQELGHTANALRFFRRAQQRSPRIRKLYALMAACLADLGRHAEAVGLCEQGLTQFPGDPELLYHHGRMLGEQGDLAGAERCLLQLIQQRQENYLQVGVEDGLHGEKSRYLLGLIYQEQGRWADAEAQHLAGLAARPDFAPCWVGVGQLYLAQERWEELQRALTGLEQCPQGDVYAAVLRARAAIVRRDFATAQHLLEHAKAQSPQMLWPRLVYSDLVCAAGADWQSCVQAHREILALAPDNAMARQRLEQLLRQPPRDETLAAPAEDAMAALGGCVIVTG